MKEQTYIAFFKDDSGNNVDFERFSYKRLDSVIRAINILWNDSLLRALNKDATHVLIYKTNYSIEGLQPIATIKLPSGAQ